MAFPSGPTNGQTTTMNGVTWTYNSTNGAWFKTAAGVSTVNVAMAAVAVSGNSALTGSVGIGVTPTTKLDIAGTTAQNVAVTTGVMDLAVSQVFTASISGATTFSFTNVPASRSVTVVLHITNPGTFLTWPTSVKWPGGTAPTFTTTGTDVVVFHTVDGGTTWRGNVFGKDVK